MQMRQPDNLPAVCHVHRNGRPPIGMCERRGKGRDHHQARVHRCDAELAPPGQQCPGYAPRCGAL